MYILTLTLSFHINTLHIFTIHTNSSDLVFLSCGSHCLCIDSKFESMIEPSILEQLKYMFNIYSNRHNDVINHMNNPKHHVHL